MDNYFLGPPSSVKLNLNCFLSLLHRVVPPLVTSRACSGDRTAPLGRGSLFIAHTTSYLFLSIGYSSSEPDRYGLLHS